MYIIHADTFSHYLQLKSTKIFILMKIHFPQKQAKS